jgi:hypothetical protein
LYFHETFDMELIGGLIGIRQDPRTLCLRPEIGWAVRQAPVVREVPALITSANVGRIRSGMTSSEVTSILGDGRVVQRGESVHRSAEGLARRTTTVLEWQEGGRGVTITFENDKVVDMHRRGLE